MFYCGLSSGKESICWNFSFYPTPLFRTPYAFVVMTAAVGGKASITPLLSQIPSFMAKLASCLNPIVYALSHPK